MTIRLTEYVRGGGCAAKLRLGQLSQVLDTLVKRNAGAERATSSSITSSPTTPRWCTTPPVATSCSPPT